MKRPSLLHCDSWSIPIHRVTQSSGRFLDHLLANPMSSFFERFEVGFLGRFEVRFVEGFEVGIVSRFCIIDGVRLL